MNVKGTIADLLSEVQSSRILLYVGLAMLIVPACMGNPTPETALNAAQMACSSSPQPQVCLAALELARDPKDPEKQLDLARAACLTLPDQKEAEKCLLTATIMSVAREQYEVLAEEFLKNASREPPASVVISATPPESALPVTEFPPKPTPAKADGGVPSQ